MSHLYLWIKWLHIVSSTVLFGMGAGIAFFFLRAQRSGDARIIAAVAGDVVFADAIFTATAVVLQPTTGIAMALLTGYPLTQPWLLGAVLTNMVGGASSRCQLSGISTRSTSSPAFQGFIQSEAFLV